MLIDCFLVLDLYGLAISTQSSYFFPNICVGEREGIGESRQTNIFETVGATWRNTLSLFTEVPKTSFHT